MSSVSVLEGFSIGIGPSSSHTVGPMRAARRFIAALKEREVLDETAFVSTELYGSLAMTGKGHATDTAILLGLEGETPEGVDPDSIPQRVELIQNQGKLNLFGRFSVDFELLFLKGKRLPFHSNAIRFTAYDKQKKQLLRQVYYSIGGGFVLEHNEAVNPSENQERPVPFPFKTAVGLIEHCQRENKAIWEIIFENEKAMYTETQIREGISRIWKAMCDSVERGIRIEGELPGGLKVPRRAAQLYKALKDSEHKLAEDPTMVMEWVSLFSLAVNEENAAGSRIVTAPTNGSSGVIPAVLHYAQKFVPTFNEESIFIFFLTATAMLILYKENASISAAEMGCQGEIGVSASMAAAGLTAILGGTNDQIENAAEIAMEHHLGLTCDPIGGLVQIPCIERNTMGAIKAINAARLALRGTGQHAVSLDAVIRAMNETGKNMSTMYKETSEGGLALQISLTETAC
ncbi:MAG: L-serine ammonia-lyase [Parachlamydiales bacterium]|nr:L-serine ammonia-lyase [Parachlamydiales bacterium]